MSLQLERTRELENSASNGYDAPPLGTLTLQKLD